MNIRTPVVVGERLEVVRSKPPRFLFETVADLRSMPDEEYLIDGWIPERSVGLLYGRWGSGKTFIGFDWACHLAFGLPDWHGAKLPGVPCDVLVIAREGHAGFVKRVSAFMAHHGLTEDCANLIFMRSPISFLDDAGFDQLKAAIKALGRPFRFVLVDTVGRVLPGADMAKEAPITLFMERLQQIGEITGGTALGVHHENKGGDANGSMFFQNNSDFMFQVSREGEGGSLVRGKLTCMKQKEGDDLWSRDITFAKVDLPEGKSSLVVESIAADDRSSGQSSSTATPRQGRALDALDEVALTYGEPAPLDIKGVVAVPSDRWRDELFARGILDRAAKNPRTDFKRIKDQLANKFLIGERDGLVWRAK
jgi:AAA domain-containing protein